MTQREPVVSRTDGQVATPLGFNVVSTVVPSMVSVAVPVGTPADPESTALKTTRSPSTDGFGVPVKVIDAQTLGRAGVVTSAAAESAELPELLTARTVYEYCVDAVSPLSR